MPPSWHPTQPTAIRSQARLFLCAWRMQLSSTTQEVASFVPFTTHAQHSILAAPANLGKLSRLQGHSPAHNYQQVPFVYAMCYAPHDAK